MAPKRKGSKKNFNKGKPFRESKELSHDVFEAEEETGRRKGNDLDEVENLEYDAGEIDEEDDEEIDSDEAFDESDEERFENFKFAEKPVSQKKKSKSVRFSGENEEQEIDMNETDEEEDEEDEEGGEFMDLSQMLAGDDDEAGANNMDDSDDEDKEEEEEFRGFDDIEDSEDSEVELMDDDDNENKVADFIQDLGKRKRAGDQGQSKKRHLKEKNEGKQESEFNLGQKDQNKLDISDLMETVDNEAAFGNLRQGLEDLKGKGKNLVTQALDAPLAKRIQDRMEREAAYKSAKTEVSKWQATVRQNREAEHLEFPMINSDTPKHPKSVSTMVNQFAAQTDLEKQISDALSNAGMKDEELEAFEALKLNKLSVEEVEERRKELRMMRELMFRHEIKAKRLKKIKSKSYRKLQRKEKDKLTQLTSVDHEMDSNDKLEAAMSRAEERMSLKHKNTSKWAKRALARGAQDEGTREAIMEQLRRGEELRRRIDGNDGEDSSDDDSAVDDKEYVTQELSKLQKEIGEDVVPVKGIMGMKFMQDAARRELDQTKRMADDFQEEWLAEENEDGTTPKEKDEHFTVVSNNPGRMAFGAKAKKLSSKKNKQDEEEDTVAPVTSINVNEAGQIKKVSNSASHTTRTTSNVNVKPSPLADLDDDNEESNPWLQADTSRLGKKSTKKNKAISGETETRAEHSISKLKKAKKGKNEDVAEDVELDLTKVMSVKSQTKNSNKNEKATEQKTPAKKKNVAAAKNAKGESDSESDNESGDQNNQMVHKDNISFSQRELVARAFANDDVVAEFEDEKMGEIQEDGDKVEDLTLPGWGEWAGAGIKKRKNKKQILKVTKGIDQDKRKDAKLKSVIISEKVNKKAEKYRVSAIPFPFKTMEQYERSLRAPIGKEWNTRDTFQKMTKPKVITKLGQVIDPLKAPFA
ncbi:small-subunit processome [Backusella circina FSU 941]|nr:small-subunit processome [Backusella circina FSU 941]